MDGLQVGLLKRVRRLGLNRHNFMEAGWMERQLPFEAWRVLPGKRIAPFRTNG